jgi:hypothetical protein
VTNADHEDLARELYEADAIHNQAVVGFPIEHWEQADEPTKARWRNVARTALAWRGGATDASSGQREGGDQ